MPADDDLQTSIEFETPETLMRDAIALWMMEVNQDPSRAPQTRQFYRRVVGLLFARFVADKDPL